LADEATLKDSLFQEVADSAPVMLWRINASFDCDWANAAWFEFTGGTLAEQSGFAWVDLVHPDDRARVKEAFSEAFEARDKVSVEFRIRRRDGHYRWILDSGSPFFENGDFAGFVGSCFDITERKEAEERTAALGSDFLSRPEERARRTSKMMKEQLQDGDASGSNADPETTHAASSRGLSGWQERRAKELLSADLSGAVSLHDVAAECGLSTRHFSRAFKNTTGLAPHAWYLARRVEVAKEALRSRQLPLSVVALTCGFSDQSHFTRVFSRIVGTSPGAWRRTCELRAAEASNHVSGAGDENCQA
jgi:PAS domain S-box-containing protein